MSSELLSDATTWHPSPENPSKLGKVTEKKNNTTKLKHQQQHKTKPTK